MDPKYQYAVAFLTYVHDRPSINILWEFTPVLYYLKALHEEGIENSS